MGRPEGVRAVRTFCVLAPAVAYQRENCHSCPQAPDEPSPPLHLLSRLSACQPGPEERKRRILFIHICSLHTQCFLPHITQPIVFADSHLEVKPSEGCFVGSGVTAVIPSGNRYSWHVVHLTSHFYKGHPQREIPSPLPSCPGQYHNAIYFRSLKFNPLSAEEFHLSPWVYN